jgi:hypothetical protein
VVRGSHTLLPAGAADRPPQHNHSPLSASLATARSAICLWARRHAGRKAARRTAVAVRPLVGSEATTGVGTDAIETVCMVCEVWVEKENGEMAGD